MDKQKNNEIISKCMEYRKLNEYQLMSELLKMGLSEEQSILLQVLSEKIDDLNNEIEELTNDNERDNEREPMYNEGYL